MGVHVGSGTIRIGVSDLTLDDVDDEDGARDDLTSAVESAISGACEAYRHSLTLESVELFDVEATTKVARVRLTASAEMTVAYNEADGEPEPDDWASDYGWNYLVFQSGDVDFDYTVLDPDTGDSERDADWSSTTEAVDDEAQRSRLYAQQLRERIAQHELVIGDSTRKLGRIRELTDDLSDATPGSMEAAVDNIRLVAMFGFCTYAPDGVPCGRIAQSDHGLCVMHQQQADEADAAAIAEMDAEDAADNAPSSGQDRIPGSDAGPVQQ